MRNITALKNDVVDAVLRETTAQGEASMSRTNDYGVNRFCHGISRRPKRDVVATLHQSRLRGNFVRGGSTTVLAITSGARQLTLRFQTKSLQCQRLPCRATTGLRLTVRTSPSPNPNGGEAVTAPWPSGRMRSALRASSR